VSSLPIYVIETMSFVLGCDILKLLVNRKNSGYLSDLWKMTHTIGKKSGMQSDI